MDWSRRAEYVRSRHGVTASRRHGVNAACADEAVDDEYGVLVTPDPASRSGRSVRVIGYSASAHDVLTVILVAADADELERPTRDWWESNAWVASARERRLYGKEN